ncbi:hypothetical protein QLG13_28055 (plasmid) [Rhodococcus aetherivorans]|uniref:hypothetical protein n=1 Tax=Rhodococcus aetherivorans TaxID=191292 RepID=UPI003EBF85F1
MSGRSAVQFIRVRNAVGIAVALAAACVAAPATASTSPLPGSAGSSDTGSSVVDFGSSVVDLGSSIVGSGSSGLFAPTQRCDESTLSGGEGITDTVHQLGRGGPTSFVLSFETYDVPDQIEVFYEGALLHNTGYIGDNVNEGTGSVVINVPARNATSVLVRVTGLSGTDWEYTVHCPI